MGFNHRLEGKRWRIREERREDEWEGAWRMTECLQKWREKVAVAIAIAAAYKTSSSQTWRRTNWVFPNSCSPKNAMQKPKENTPFFLYHAFNAVPFGSIFINFSSASPYIHKPKPLGYYSFVEISEERIVCFGWREWILWVFVTLSKNLIFGVVLEYGNVHSEAAFESFCVCLWAESADWCCLCGHFFPFVWWIRIIKVFPCCHVALSSYHFTPTWQLASSFSFLFRRSVWFWFEH